MKSTGMNVVQMISSEGFYGAESMLVNLTKSLRTLGCDASIAIFRDRRRPHSELDEVAIGQLLPTHAIECAGRWDWASVERIRDIASDRQAAVFHAHGYKADLYAYAGLRRKRVALVSTCHNWPSRQPLMQAYAKADRMVLRRFDRVTTPSPEVAGVLLRSGVKADKIAYIRNGVDIGRFRGGATALKQARGGGRRRHSGFVGRRVL